MFRNYIIKFISLLPTECTTLKYIYSGKIIAISTKEVNKEQIIAMSTIYTLEISKYYTKETTVYNRFLYSTEEVLTFYHKNFLYKCDVLS